VGVALDIEALYRSYAPMVLRRCRRLIGNPDKAVDAMHDVFASLLRAKSRLHDSRPASLLLRIATNVCLDLIRAERRHAEDLDEERLLAIAAAEEPGGRSLARLTVRKLFGGEPESTRVMAVMHLVDGLSLEEVGREVGLTAAGVRKRLRGLRLRLAARAESTALLEEAP
jgi:RNA polymerase sigma-70 factor (ECF subfamily)